MTVIRTYFFLVGIIAAYHVAAEVTNGTALIITTKRATFANPPFNIQDNTWFQSFHALINQIANDQEVKVVVFDSSAPDFWMAHIDIINPVLQEYNDNLLGNLTLLTNLPVLTIAVVQGIARGSGAELATSFDVRFGGKEKAKLGQIEVGVGLLASGGEMLLPGLVGRSKALEILLGAEDFDADTAAQYGWINRAISDDDFEDFVDSYARRVASFHKFAVAETKRIVNKRSSYPAAEGYIEGRDMVLQIERQPNVQARLAKFGELGLQSDWDYEVHADQKLMQLVGQGPWNV